jgi:hypothetical protein
VSTTAAQLKKMPASAGAWVTHQNELAAFTRDGAHRIPYINHLPQITDVFVVIPIRQWYEEPR